MQTIQKQSLIIHSIESSTFNRIFCMLEPSIQHSIAKSMIKNPSAPFVPSNK